MAELIKMPRLSDTMEEGTVATWFKKVGDKISEGDILAEIETDKATMEFESFYDGTLLYIGVKEGEATKVDEPLAIIGEANEDYKSLLDDAKKSDEVIKEKTEIKEEPEIEKKAEIIEENEVIKTELEDTPELISKTISSTNRIFISPLAKKLAKINTVEISAQNFDMLACTQPSNILNTFYDLEDFLGLEVPRHHSECSLRSTTSLSVSYK